MEDNNNAGTFNVDTKEPMGYSVSIDQFYINNTNKNTMSFKFTGAEVGATYNYSINSSEGGTAVSGQGTINDANQQISGIDVSGLNDGTLTLTVYLTDSVGNQGADATATVVKDTVVPADYSVKIDQDYINNSNQNALSFTFSGAEVGASYNYTITDGTNSVEGSGTISTATDKISGIDVSSLSDGTLTLTVYLTDEAGNKGGDVTDTVKKDVVAPTVTVDSLITSDNTPELTGTVDDGSATIQVTVGSYTYQATVLTTANKDGTYNWTTDVTDTLSDGTYDVSVTATDQAGNVGNDDTSNELIIDTTAPTLDSITSENNSFVSGTQTFIFDFNDANLAYLEFDVYRPGDTEDTRVQVTLPADNSEIQNYQDQFANFGVISASYNAAEQKWIIDINTADSFWPDGTTRFYIEAGDSAGNQWGDMNNDPRWGGLKLYTYIFDNTAPTTNLTVSPANPDGNDSWYTSQPTITLTCADDTSGCDKIYYKWDTDTDYTEVQLSDSVTQAETTAPEGAHTLSYYSKDKAGNSETAKTEGFKVDTEAPTVNAGDDKIANTEFTQDATVKDTNSGIASYSWEKVSAPDGGTITFGSPNSEDTTISADKDGVYTIRLTVTDNAGNSNSDEMQLTWDTTPPSFTINNGPEASPVKEDTINITINDVNEIAVSKYGFSSDDTCDSNDTYNNDFTSGTDFTIAGDHTDYLCVMATDNAGNPGYQLVGKLNTDNTAPTLTSVSIASNNSNDSSLAKVGDTVTLTFTANESIQTPTVTIAGNSVVVSGSGTSWTATYAMQSDDLEGVIPFTIDYKDIAGNSGAQVTGTTDRSSVVFDKTAPYVAGGTPAPDSYEVDPSTKIQVDFSEPVQCSNGDWTSCISVIDENSNAVTGSAEYSSTNENYTLTFTPANVLDSNMQYTIIFNGIIDMSGNGLLVSSPYNYPDNPWVFTTATYYDISLHKGWNLISIPTVPDDTSISSVLGDAASKIDVVWTYDAETGDWHVAHPNSDAPGDLTEMTAGYGYWINSTGSTKIKGFGSWMKRGPFVPQSRTLFPGWNLVGYYQLSGRNPVSTLDEAFGDLSSCRLYKYDNENEVFLPKSHVTEVRPGDAFWILVQEKREY